MSFSATGKVITILDTIACAPGPLTLARIGMRTGLSKSTVHRIVQLLEVHAVVRRQPGGYTLGDRPFHWSRAMRSYFTYLTRRSVPSLVRLHSQSGLIASLGVLTGSDLLYLHSLYSNSQLAVIDRTEYRVPAHWTASGKVLLACRYFDSDIDRYQLELSASTRITITSPEELTVELAKIRTAGYGVSVGEYLPDIDSVAAPVMIRGQTLAAISLAGPTGRIDIDQAARQVRSAADAIAVQLGSGGATEARTWHRSVAE